MRVAKERLRPKCACRAATALWGRLWGTHTPVAQGRGELSKKDFFFANVWPPSCRGGGRILTHGGDEGRGGWLQPFLGKPGSGVWDPPHPGSRRGPTSASTQHCVGPSEEIPPHRYLVCDKGKVPNLGHAGPTVSLKREKTESTQHAAPPEPAPRISSRSH